jgi:hypothetical protein
MAPGGLPLNAFLTKYVSKLRQAADISSLIERVNRTRKGAKLKIDFFRLKTMVIVLLQLMADIYYLYFIALIKRTKHCIYSSSSHLRSFESPGDLLISGRT